MISAIDNKKNQYYEPVNAVNMQASRGYTPEFYQDMMKKTGFRENFTGQERVEKTFASLLAYGRGSMKGSNPFATENDMQEFNLSHPNVKDENRAQKFDFIA